MLPVGDERNTIDALAHGDFVLSENFVACYSNQGCRHTQVELCWGRAAGELLDGLDGSSDRAGDDHQHNEDAGQVLGAIVAIGVAVVGGAIGEYEGDPEGNSGQHIAEVVEGVGEKSRAAADARDGKLNC